MGMSAYQSHRIKNNYEFMRVNHFSSITFSICLLLYYAFSTYTEKLVMENEYSYIIAKWCIGHYVDFSLMCEILMDFSWKI